MSRIPFLTFFVSKWKLLFYFKEQAGKKKFYNIFKE